MRALKEVDQKYVGNRPIKLSKSTWKERAVDSDRNKKTKKFSHAINNESKTQIRFKKLKKKQDPERQKALQKVKGAEQIDAAAVVAQAMQMKKHGNKQM